MTTYRVGVVSDTHVPEFQANLHEALFSRLRGVDLILHAGDISEPSTLDALATIAPVTAVRGNHDNFDLPLQRVVECGGLKIGLIHGHRGRLREFPGVAWNEALAGRAFWWNGVKDHVLSSFAHEPVHAIVFGHIHRPLIEQRMLGGEGWCQTLSGRRISLGRSEPSNGPSLLFNPGATYHCTAAEARRRLNRGGPLHHRLYYVSRSRWQPGEATAGLLTITDGKIVPEILFLDRNSAARAGA